MTRRPHRSFAERLFCASLWLYPREMRESDGLEMRRLFRELESDARTRGSSRRFLLETLRDSIGGPWQARRSCPYRQTTPDRPEASVLTTLPHDLMVALRRLIRQPGFTFIAVLTLALGIGANTAIFSVVYGVLLRPLGLEEAKNLVVVRLQSVDQPSEIVGFWPQHVQSMQENAIGQGPVESATTFMFNSVT
ncbi:MAG: hypothetical protein AAF725_11295, partial [Acidobacteriota bacterium]